MPTADVLQQGPLLNGGGIMNSTTDNFEVEGEQAMELANHDSNLPVNGTLSNDNEHETSSEAQLPTPQTSPKKRTAITKAAAQPAKKRATAKSCATAPVKVEDSEIRDAAHALLAVAEPAPTKPERASSDSKKTTVSSRTAQEWDAEEPFSTSKSSSSLKASGDDTGEAPTSPSKSPRKKASPTKRSGGDEQLTVHGTPRKRSAVKGELATPRGIPKSWEEAGKADRMLFTMKEEGRDWASIRAAWKKVTGEETGASSLPNRYNRIKCNMLRLQDGDALALLLTKTEIEHDFETNKWGLISNGIVQRGGRNYPIEFLKKQYKELEAKGGIAALEAEAEAKEKDDDDCDGDDDDDDDVVAGDGEGRLSDGGEKAE